MVTSVAVGAPELAFPLPTAPIAPNPFVPDVFTPVKLMTVMEEATRWVSVAVTVTFVKGEAENARQISDVPNCALVLWTRAQVNPAPVTVMTVVLGDETPSLAMNASNSSFPAIVEKLAVRTVVDAVP
jgi:hypothetical protein